MLSYVTKIVVSRTNVVSLLTACSLALPVVASEPDGPEAAVAAADALGDVASDVALVPAAGCAGAGLLEDGDEVLDGG